MFVVCGLVGNAASSRRPAVVGQRKALSSTTDASSTQPARRPPGWSWAVSSNRSVADGQKKAGGSMRPVVRQPSPGSPRNLPRVPQTRSRSGLVSLMCGSGLALALCMAPAALRHSFRGKALHAAWSAWQGSLVSVESHLIHIEGSAKLGWHRVLPVVSGSGASALKIAGGGDQTARRQWRLPRRSLGLVAS